MAVAATVTERKTHEDVEPKYQQLKRAAELVEESVRRDNVLPLLEDTFNAQISGGYTVIEPVTNSLKAWQPFDLRQTIPLPDALFDAYDTLEVKCQMGLFPQISRAWISIDDTIFLWDYATTDYQTIPVKQTVIATEVVDVRPGILIDSVKQMLVVVCSTHITLYGLCSSDAVSQPPSNGRSKNDEPSNHFVLYNIGDIGCAATGVNGIVGSRSGRIFVYGKAGVWEVIYQNQERLMRRGKCWKVTLTGSTLSDYFPFGGGNEETEIISAAVDDDRRVFYTLNAHNTIDVYHLERSGQAFTKTASRRNLLNLAQNLTQPSPLLNAKSTQIVKIAVVKVRDSRVVHLLALTKHGVRLYLTTWPGYGIYRQPSATPACLDLVHCRMPPAFQGAGGSNVVYKATHALMSHGVFASTIVSNSDQDIMLLANSDYGQAARFTGDKANQQPALNEHATTLQLSGQVWSLAEQDHPFFDQSTLPSADKGSTPLHQLALQTSLPSRSLLAFAHNGLSIIDVRWPVDILRDLLRVHATTGIDARELTNFTESFGRKQACAMAIFLAADILGEKRRKGDQQAAAFGSRGDVNDIAIRFLVDFGGKPSPANGESSTSYGGSGAQDSTGASKSIGASYTPSARKEALSLCLSRILRSIWYSPIARTSPTPIDPQRQVANLPERTLVDVQNQLVQLEQFLLAHRMLFTSNISNSLEAEQLSAAYSAENDDVSAMILLTSLSIQAISFVLFLMDYKFQDIAAGLPSSAKSSLNGISFGGLIVTPEGRSIINSLVTALVDIQIRQQVPIDSVFDVLQRRCGSLCPPDGNVLFKAVEQLKRANETAAGGERLEFLQESLNLFQRSANRLDIERLREVTKELTRLQYSQGAVTLAEKCATAWDQQGLGLRAWQEGCTDENDPRMSLRKQRLECYKIICEILVSIDEVLEQAASKTDAARSAILNERSATYQKIFDSPDEMLHCTLYDWMLERSQQEDLLELRTPFIEKWMRSHPQTFEKWDLLWQHFVRLNNPSKAAETLLTIGTSQFPIDLEKRIEFLSYAAGNARVATGKFDHYTSNGASAASLADFVEHVEDLLDVAKVQVEIVQVLEESGSNEYAEMLKDLRASLWTISMLYERATEPLKLCEQSLLILQISGHEDQDLLYDTWTMLFATVAESLQSSENKSSKFEARVATVGKRFHRQAGPFPAAIYAKALAAWLSKYFESQLKHDSNDIDRLGSGILARVLLASGLATAEAMENIGQILLSRVSPFASKETQTQLLEELSSLVSDFTSDSAKHQDRRSRGRDAAPKPKLKPMITRYLEFGKHIAAPKNVLDRLEVAANA